MANVGCFLRINEDIWAQAKAKAALEKITLSVAIERLLKAWVGQSS